MSIEQPASQFVVLTGASGSGKTTIAKRCAELYPSLISVHHSDAVRVPSIDQMIAEFGSTKEWQRYNILKWFRKLVYFDDQNILFEGQSRIEFIVQAKEIVGISNITTILVDCNDATRVRRLKVDREQPDLANETMLNWAAYLRREAAQFECKILDTSESTVDEGAAAIVRHFC